MIGPIKVLRLLPACPPDKKPADNAKNYCCQRKRYRSDQHPARTMRRRIVHRQIHIYKADGVVGKEQARYCESHGQNAEQYFFEGRLRIPHVLYL